MSEKGKEAGIAVTAEELARINRFAKKELRAEEVYTFAVKLCDNEVDRDFERFDRAALEKLSELFVGRTGIFDHSWSAGGQTARIYRAEVIEEETRTTAGDKYCWCKGWAYMLRTEKNAELIAEIEGGIKKEVSVGCSAAKRSCSICGKDAGLCEHERGKYYGGKLCYAVLSDITDAYEWSFVAVPAQRAAGVVKRFGQGEGSLKAMVRACGSRAQVRELEELETFSALGKSDLGALRRVEEGVVLPTTAIRTQENLVKLHKRGRMLVASYEAIRFQRLDLFSVTLRQIGAYIARMHLDDAVQVLMNGDGNNNAADAYEIGSGSGKISGTAGTLTYSALLEFWSKFDPYSMNTMLVSNDVMLQMLKLSEFQNPLTGLNFQGTGTLSTPLGAKLLRTSAVPAGKLIGLDKNYALEHICGSEVMVEYDKLIDRQIERAAITSISGFAKPYQEASKVLTV